jgi:hypothetical protein
MTEADIASQLIQMMSLTLQGMGVVFSIVSAYVVALYYFLYRAPLILKLGSFLFFTLIMALLVFFTLGAFDHGAAIERTLAELAQKGPLSPIGQAALARGNLGTGSIDEKLRWSIEAAFGLVYLSLFYLTFFHRWAHADYTERD